MVTEFNAELGWHTWSHRDLTTLSEEEIRKEITPPFPMKTFAYPYGRYKDLVLKLVKEQYETAYSVDITDGTKYTIPRNYL
jgi:peptidoglycan/xylan/chitin deacetylase (PgdA/CDA1 family)